MVIGVLSDTHGFFHPALPEVFESVDMIIHAGDIGAEEVLRQLEKLAPTRAVWGNVDDRNIRQQVPEHQHFSVEGLEFWVTHIAGRPGRWVPEVRKRLTAAPPDVLVCGHSHILRIERVPEFGGMLYLNPGAAGRQGFHREKTCVRLHVAEKRLLHAEVIHLDKWQHGGYE